MILLMTMDVDTVAVEAAAADTRGMMTVGYSYSNKRVDEPDGL